MVDRMSKPLSRRRVIQTGAAAAASFALGRLVPARAAGRDLKFIAIGDWGMGTDAERKVAAAIAKVAADSGCDFIVSLGDNFYPKGVKNERDPQWKEKFEDVYSAESLQVPWHAVLGNHDHDGDAQAEIDYSSISSRWRMPAHYYKRVELFGDGVEADFFFTDTQPIFHAYNNWLRFVYFPPGEQVKWLERELAASKAAWKIVVGHHPIFSSGDHGGTKALIELFKPLFEKYGVHAYLNGHDHDLEHVVVNNVSYLTSGAGSAPRAVKPTAGARFASGTAGFMRARIAAEEMTVEFFDADAKSIYRAVIPRVGTAL
jgi:acid phosphatase